MIRNLLTTKEADEQLGVSETFLTKGRFFCGGIPFVRLGHRSIRYRPEDLEAYIQANTFTSGYSASQPSQQGLATA